MRRCPNCGYLIADGASDCPDCGYRGVPYPVPVPTGEPGESPPLPPPPSLAARNAPTPPLLASGMAPPDGWPKTVAVVGVVTGFFFFWTIPGWFLLRHYRKWRRGEVGGSGLIVWGYVSLGLWAFFVLTLVVVTVNGGA